MKSDWLITGSGGLSIIEETGSKRCQLSAIKQLLWTGRNNLVDCEVMAEIKMDGSTNTRGGLLLRCSSSIQNCYQLLIYGPRTYFIQKVVNGVTTTLSTATSSQAYNQYVKTRFRVDGFQLSVEEYIDGIWQLVSMVQDSTQAVASGYCGIFGFSVNSGYSLLFDNIEISEKA